MLLEHQLKTWPEPFQAVWEGKKRAELRENDRDFEVADSLVLREFDPETSTYSGRRITAEITHVLHGGRFGLAEGYVMLSLGNVTNYHDQA